MNYGCSLTAAPYLFDYMPVIIQEGMNVRFMFA